MIRAISLVLTFLLMGDLVALHVALPVPGPAIGLALFSAWLAARGGPDDAIDLLFDKTAPHFALFFVPAAVGFVANADVLAASWPYFLLAVVFGTSATLAATGLLAQFLLQALTRKVL